MDLTDEMLPPYEPCTENDLPAGYIDPPPRFVEPQNEFRLIPELRAAAQTRNPYKILARSAAAFFKAEHPTTTPSPNDDVEFGNALADLAVTGRMAYSLFKTP